MNVAIFCDPPHLTLKDFLIDRLTEDAFPVDDLGCSTDQNLLHVVRSILSKTHTHGILLSDNPHTAAMLANRFPGIRAVVCGDVFAARRASSLSNANLITLSGDAAQPDRAWDIVRIWLAGEFLPPARNGHAHLLNIIDAIDRQLEKSERSAALLDTRTPI
jgi:RpiB/LacA/LacB family sugar-phosphate isomerase